MTAELHFSYHFRHIAMPAAICSDGVLAIISPTEIPPSAASDPYKTRYLLTARLSRNQAERKARHTLTGSFPRSKNFIFGSRGNRRFNRRQ